MHLGSHVEPKSGGVVCFVSRSMPYILIVVNSYDLVSSINNFQIKHILAIYFICHKC